MSVHALNTKLKCRTDTYQNWKDNNPLLLVGEIGYESDTNKIKIGDGSTNWNDLPYLTSGSDTPMVSFDTMLMLSYSFVSGITANCLYGNADTSGMITDLTNYSYGSGSTVKHPNGKFTAPVAGLYRFTVKGGGGSGSSASFTNKSSGNGGGEGGTVTFCTRLSKGSQLDISIGVGEISQSFQTLDVSSSSVVDTENSIYAIAHNGNGINGGYAYLNGVELSYGRGQKGYLGKTLIHGSSVSGAKLQGGYGGGNNGGDPVSSDSYADVWFYSTYKINDATYGKYGSQLCSVSNGSSSSDVIILPPASSATSGCGGGGGTLIINEDGETYTEYPGSHGANGYILVEYCSFPTEEISVTDSMTRAETAATQAYNYLQKIEKYGIGSSGDNYINISETNVITLNTTQLTSLIVSVIEEYLNSSGTKENITAVLQ